MARDKLNARPPKSWTKAKSRCLDLAGRGMVRSRARPENLDIRTLVVDAARLAGFHSTPTIARDRSGYAKARARVHQATERRHAQGLGNGG